MSVTDHVAMGAHPAGAGLDDGIRHACPECPSPLDRGALVAAASIICRWCHGTGLLTTGQLAAWQRDALASPGR